MPRTATFLASAIVCVVLPLALLGGCSSDSPGDAELDASTDRASGDEGIIDGSTKGAGSDGGGARPGRADASFGADGALIEPPFVADVDSGSTGGPGGDAGGLGSRTDAGGEPDASGPSAGCGARKATTCTANEYCSYTLADICGQADAAGVCKPRPKVCPQFVTADGFCGCNGKNYGNECFAEQAGTAVLHAGACTATPGGGNGKMCAGIAGIACSKGEFCDLAQGQGCDHIADGAGVCEAVPSACRQDYKPVCGCDRHTYSNACSAHLSSMSVLHTDACSELDCAALAGSVVYGTGPGPKCPKGQVSVGPVKLTSGAMPIEGAICCVASP